MMNDTIKKCACVCVSIGSYKNQVCLPRPKHMVGQTHGSANDIICVDACLKEEILKLWELGISTTGCCCGHNIAPVYAFIGVVEEDIHKMIDLGYTNQINETDHTRMDGFKPKSIYNY